MVKDEYLITIEREQKLMLQGVFTSLDRRNGKQEVTEGSDSNSMNGDMKIIVDCYREKEYSLFPIQPKLSNFPCI